MPPTRCGLAHGLLTIAVVFAATPASGDLPHAVAVADDVADRVLLFDPHTGAYLGDLTQPDSTNLAAPFDCEAGPALKVTEQGPDGKPVEVTYPNTLLVSDLRNGRVVAFDADGGKFLKVLITGLTPRGLAYLPDGKLLVAAGSAGVRTYTASGTLIGTRVPASHVHGPVNAWDVLVRPFARDGQGELLVSDPTLDVILRFDLNGGRIGVFAKLPSFKFVEQLAERANGNVLAVDVFGHAVREFDANGTLVRTITVTRPRGVFELFNGNLLIASEDGVQEFSGADGALIETEMAGYPTTAPRCIQYLRCRLPCLRHRRGDMNGDGVLNFGDIHAFVLAMTSPTVYDQTYPAVDRVCTGDINRDGVLNFADIDPFINLFVE